MTNFKIIVLLAACGMAMQKRIACLGTLAKFSFALFPFFLLGACASADIGKHDPYNATEGLPKIDAVKHIVLVVLENEDANDVLKNEFMKSLSETGAYLSEYHGVTHMSYRNYIAMTSGDTQGVSYLDRQENLEVTSIANLLDEKRLAWAQFAQGYPGDRGKCYLDSKNANQHYARKHVPFLSYKYVTDGDVCKNHVFNANEFDFHMKNLPSYSFYTPNLMNDGHDTNIQYASDWLKVFLTPFLENLAAGTDEELNKTLVIVTFDEDKKPICKNSDKPIFTVFLGRMVKAGKNETKYNHYDLLRTVEDIFELGNLGRKDKDSSPITGIWKH
jgi:acid phosphatase